MQCHSSSAIHLVGLTSVLWVACLLRQESSGSFLISVVQLLEELLSVFYVTTSVP